MKTENEAVLEAVALALLTAIIILVVGYISLSKQNLKLIREKAHYKATAEYCEIREKANQ